jgi:hypothetical protein
MPPASAGDGPDGGARTRIPQAIWTAGSPLYVGLEIYLPLDRGARDGEALAQRLIACIQACVATAR